MSSNIRGHIHVKYNNELLCESLTNFIKRIMMTLSFEPSIQYNDVHNSFSMELSNLYQFILNNNQNIELGINELMNVIMVDKLFLAYVEQFFILIALHELENSSTNNNIQLNEEIINEEQDEETNESDNSESDESDDDESESSDNNNNGEYEQLVIMQENNVHINNEEDDIGEDLCNLTANEPDDIQNTLFTLYNHIIQLSGLYVLHRIHHNHTVEITQSLYTLLCDVNQTEYY